MKKFLVTLSLLIAIPVSAYTNKKTKTPAPIPTPPANLVTNEYAYYNPLVLGIATSSIWEMDSGSLFTKDDQYWTGVPDDTSPNVYSTNGTDSAIFRLNTKQSYTNETTSFDFTFNDFVTTKSTPAVDWDGAHVFMHYVSEFNLYYVSFLRRDKKIVIKKKCVGGPDNGGTYYELSPETKFNLPNPAHIAVTALDIGKTVILSLAVNGTTVLTATDTGVGCPVITAGDTGLRLDNTDAMFTNFNVKSL